MSKNVFDMNDVEQVEKIRIPRNKGKKVNKNQIHKMKARAKRQNR